MNMFSSLRAAVALSALTLASCGYSPLYAPEGGASAASGRMQVGPVKVEQEEKNVGERRSAQTIAQELKLSFPNSGADMDLLTVTIIEDETTLAVRRTAAIQRAEITLKAKMEITDPDGKRLLATSMVASAPYNVEVTPLSTESSKIAARMTSARNLASEISRRVYLYYSTHPMPASRPEDMTGSSRKR